MTLRGVALGVSSIALLLSGCGGADAVEESSAGDAVATTAQAWTIPEAGCAWEWVYVSAPDAAKSIAATTGGVIYALLENGRLTRGNGTSWTHVGTPSVAVDIAVTDSGLTLYALNAPGSNWYNDAVFSNASGGIDSAWAYVKPAGGASRIEAWAWSEGVSLIYPGGAWTDQDLGRTAHGGGRNYYLYGGTAYMYLAGDYMDLTIQPPGFTQPLVVRDISGGQFLWALTERTTESPVRRLYRGTLSEAFCGDNYDNDVDGRSDLADEDCACQYFNRSGNFCHDRVDSSGSGVLLTCAGSKFVSARSGTLCIQVGNGGNDYLSSIT